MGSPLLKTTSRVAQLIFSARARNASISAWGRLARRRFLVGARSGAPSSPASRDLFLDSPPPLTDAGRAARFAMRLSVGRLTPEGRRLSCPSGLEVTVYRILPYPLSAHNHWF